MVLSPDTTDLGRLRTRKDAPVPVFDVLTDEPGLYTRRLKNAGGCDARCPSDTVWVFGEPLLQSGQYYRMFPSSAGCDSTHRIWIEDLTAPMLPKNEDTLFFTIGQTLTLQAPIGHANYQWTPSAGLLRANCASPSVMPTDSAAYSVLVFNTDSCADMLTCQLFPLPPCAPARIRMPNAFTLDGDGYNDVFKPAAHEGVKIVAYLAIYNQWGRKIYESFGASAT